MGRPVTTTVTLAIDDSDGYAPLQSLAAAGALVLNGDTTVAGVGTPDVPRRVLVHSNGNDSALTITVVGTGRPENGSPAITESFAAGNASDAVSTQDFGSVKSISFNGATAGTVFAGTNQTASGPWMPLDVNVRTQFQVGAAGFVTLGGATWQIDLTYDDVFGTALSAGVPFPRAIAWAPTIGTTGTWSGLVGSGQVFRAMRLTITAISVAPCTVQLTATSQGD